MSEKKKYKQLTILLVSDIHLSTSGCKKVGKILKENNTKIDFIINSGDMANIKVYNDEKINKDAEHVVLDLHTVLSEINSTIYYIPGNHDSPNLFNNEYKLGDGINFHKKVIEIDSDLIIAGLGGSLPAYHEGKKAWEGYPYHSESDFDSDFSSLTKEIGKHEGKQVILVTHNGPSGSSTVVYQKDIGEKVILSGSSTLQDYLKKKTSQTDILLNIHGHTHLGHGRTTIGKVQIVNPGSLMEHRFGVLFLERDSKDRWVVTKTEHHYIHH